MNESQEEKKVYAFHAVFRVDVNDVKPFQNPTETPPFDLDPQSMLRLFKTINRWLIQTLLRLNKTSVLFCSVHVAYQIKADDAGSNIVANILPTDTPLTQGVGSKGRTIYFFLEVVM